MLLDDPQPVAAFDRQGRIAHQQVCVDQDGGHDVVEIMRNAGRQLAHRCQPLLELDAFLVLALLGDVAQCDHPLARLAANGARLGFDDGARLALDQNLNWQRLAGVVQAGKGVAKIGHGMRSQVREHLAWLERVQPGQDLSPQQVCHQQAVGVIQQQHADRQALEQAFQAVLLGCQHIHQVLDLLVAFGVVDGQGNLLANGR